MKKIILLLIFILGILPLTGCEEYAYFFKMRKYKAEQLAKEEKKVEFNVMDNTQLAKIILKPEKYKLSIKKDPFEPVLSKGLDNLDLKTISLKQLLSTFEYLGVVKIGDSSSALLKVDNKKKVYAVGENIKTLIISKIESDFIVLKKGDEIFKLKRGEK